MNSFFKLNIPIREPMDNNKIRIPKILGMLKYGIRCLKNFIPSARMNKGMRKLVGLPNKNTIIPPRYAPNIPRRFFGGILG